MKTCLGCKYAEWYRTETGRLSPSGDGKCTYVPKLSSLPQAYYYVTTPHIGGGNINRREGFAGHCLYWVKSE